MNHQNNRQDVKLTIKAGIRAGFWIAFGAGAGGLQIVPQGEVPKIGSSNLPTSSTVSIPVESGK